MRIFIDGDACPVMDLTIEIGKSYDMQVLIFCDTSHFIEREGIKVTTVSKGSDAVDFKILSEIEEGDILVTQDYGLAAMALAKKAKPIHPCGFVYTENNIDQLLFKRYLSKEVRSKRKGRIKGPSKRTKEQDRAFDESLKMLIDRSLEENLEILYS